MLRNNNNVWHKPNYEYCCNTEDEQYRIFTDDENQIHDIWTNGKPNEGNSIDLEIIARDIFINADIYAAYYESNNWDMVELERVRNLKK